MALARSVLALASVAALVVSGPPAVAGDSEYTITWGAGSVCDGAARTVTTPASRAVPFIVCVTIGGQALPGHPFRIVITEPSRRSEQSLTADDSGTAGFSVGFATPGQHRVELCDAAGCVYGQVAVTVEPRPETTSAPSNPAEDADDSSGASWWIWAIAALAVVFGGGGLLLIARRRADRDEPVGEPDL